MKAAAGSLSSGGCITVSQIGTVPAINDLLVAGNFATDRTGGALKRSGNCRNGRVSIAELGNGVSFILRELVIATQVCVLFRSWNRAYTVSPLSQSLTRALHLLLESAMPNKSLELSP